MADAHESTAAISLTALAVEMEFITQQEALLTEARCGALRRGGIMITLGQTLLDRRFVQPYQIKLLMKELERRTPREPTARSTGRRHRSLGKLTATAWPAGSSVHSQADLRLVER